MGERLEADIIRAQIDEIIKNSSNGEWRDAVLTISGISLIQRRDTIPSYTDCQMFIFGKDTVKLNKLSLLTIPIKGAIAFYSDPNGNVKHIGIATSRGTVISKWGCAGHVYEHKPLYVPSDYGNPKFYVGYERLNSFKLENLL